MNRTLAALYAARLNRLDLPGLSQQVKSAYLALRKDKDGVGTLDGDPQHYWPEEARVFYYALRLDGWSHEDATAQAEQATRSR